MVPNWWKVHSGTRYSLGKRDENSIHRRPSTNPAAWYYTISPHHNAYIYCKAEYLHSIFILYKTKAKEVKRVSQPELTTLLFW
jgi:hypothetical protein